MTSILKAVVNKVRKIRLTAITLKTPVIDLTFALSLIPPLPSRGRFFYSPNISLTIRSAPLTMAVRMSMLKMTCPTY